MKSVGEDERRSGVRKKKSRIQDERGAEERGGIKAEAEKFDLREEL